MSKKVAIAFLLMIAGIAGSFVYIDKSMDKCQERMQAIVHEHFQQLETEVHVQVDGLRVDLDKFDDRMPQLILQRMPSVVTVHAQVSTINPMSGKPGMLTASGVVIGNDGKILTASHVVDELSFMDLTRVCVVFADGTERDVVQIAYGGGRNPDVGLMWIDPEGLDLHPVGVVDWKMEAIQGEQIIVIGAPYDLPFSVSSGIVSSSNRIARGPQLEDQPLIQVDAPVNGGNSGGPVFDMDGKLIGIVSWKINADGLAFIVPAKRILIGLGQCEGKEELIQLGKDE